MNDLDQFLLLEVGVLIGQDNASLDMSSFEDLEVLRKFLNVKYSINIEVGMEWPEVISTLKQGINDTRFNTAMEIV